MSNLRKRAVSGVKWTAINSAANVIINPVVLMVLARILTPAEFGKIAIVTMIIGFSKEIATMGFSKAIIQKDKIEDGDLSSVFWFEQFLGLIAFIFIYLLAPVIVSFFNAPDAILLIRVSAFVFLFEPIDLIFRALLKKDLKFNILTKATLVRVFFTEISKVALAVLGFGAMSVVIGKLVGIFVLTIILFVFFYKEKLWLPKFYFSYKKLKPYLSFGIYISGKSVFNNLFNYADEIIIGGSLGTEVLGIYHFSKQLIQYLMSLLNKPIAEVGYPLLARVNDNLERFNRNYIRLIKYIGTLSIPAHTGLAVTAPLFVPLVFGDTWIEAIPIIMILSVWGMFKSMYASIVSSALYSFGKSSWIFYATMIDLPIRALILYLVSPYGIEYIAGALSVIAIIKFIIYQLILKRRTDISLSQILINLKTVFLASLIMAFLLQIPFEQVIQFGEIFRFSFTVILGIVFYGTTMFIFERTYLISTLKMIKNGDKND